MVIFLSILIYALILFFIYWLYKNNLFGSFFKEVFLRPEQTRDVFSPYRVKQTIMTSAERVLFENLRNVLGFKYDVYPQVNLDKIIYVNGVYGKDYIYSLRRINQKSVDYLAVDRSTQSPVFAIELDDYTHERYSRVKRDNFVGELFRRTNFPLVRFNPGQYGIEELKTILSKYL